MLGVGMVIIQEHTHKIVMVWEKEKRYWFFPRGRKDVGESLEVAALREGYEESGYTPEFMPHYGNMHQPRPPSHTDEQYTEPTCEPIFVTLMHWSAKARKERDGRVYVKPGGEYLITWFLGKIASDAVSRFHYFLFDDPGIHLLLIVRSVNKVPGWKTSKTMKLISSPTRSL
jgi:8-oxo-dGTP pyrophosphatase MutT (NUDIX family)